MTATSSAACNPKQRVKQRAALVIPIAPEVASTCGHAVGAQIFQGETHEEALIRLDVLIADEGPLIGHVDQEAIVLVAQAKAVRDRLIAPDVVAEIAEERPI